MLGFRCIEFGTVDIALYDLFNGFDGDTGESMHSGTTVSRILEMQVGTVVVPLPA